MGVVRTSVAAELRFWPILALLGFGLGQVLRLAVGLDLRLYLDPTRKWFLSHNNKQLDPWKSAYETYR